MDNTTLASGILLLIAMYFGTQVVFDHSGSAAAKQALQAYSSCLEKKPSSVNESSAEYDVCISGLQTQVKELINSGEIDLDRCELKEEDKTVAQCYLWVWYLPRSIVLTDKDLLKSLETQNNSTMVEKLQKYFSIFLENSSQTTKVSTTQKSISGSTESASEQRNVISHLPNLKNNSVQTIGKNFKLTLNNKLDEPITGQKGPFQQLVSDIKQTVKQPAQAILNLPSKVATNSQSLLSNVQNVIEQPAQILKQITPTKNVQSLTPHVSTTNTDTIQPSHTVSSQEENPFSFFGKLGELVNQGAQTIGKQIASLSNVQSITPEVSITKTVVNQPTQTVVKPMTKAANPFSFFDKLQQFVNPPANTIGKQFTSTTREIVEPLSPANQELVREVKTQASNPSQITIGQPLKTLFSLPTKFATNTETLISEPKRTHFSQPEELLESQKNTKQSGLWNKFHRQLNQPRETAQVKNIVRFNEQEVSETSQNQPSQTQVFQFQRPSNDQQATQTFKQTTVKQPKQKIKYITLENQRQFPSEVIEYQRAPKQSSQVYEVIVPGNDQESVEESQMMIQQPKQSQQTQLYEIVVPENDQDRGVPRMRIQQQPKQTEVYEIVVPDNDQETDIRRVIKQQSPKQTEVYEIVVPGNDGESTDEKGLFKSFIQNIQQPQQTKIFQVNKPAVKQQSSNYHGLFSRLGSAFKKVTDNAADIITQPLNRQNENSQNRYSVIRTQDNPDQRMTVQKLRSFFPKITFHNQHFNL